MLAVVRGRSNVRPLPSVVDETVTRSCNNTTISRTRNVRRRQNSFRVENSADVSTISHGGPQVLYTGVSCPKTETFL